MSYSNGLGNLQHLIGSLATNGTKNTNNNPVAKGGDGSSPISKIGSTDGAQLSSVSSLVSKASSIPDVRTEKVAALQQSIAAGTYNVSASDVAGSIINSLLA